MVAMSNKARKSAPREVEDFNQFVVATGGRPLLRVGDSRLLAGPFDLAVTITDNAAVAADLTLQSVWDKRVQTQYGSSTSNDVDAILRLAGAQLYINDADFRAEATALKEALDNQAYIHTVRAGKTHDFPLRGHITEPWATFEFHEAANTAVERVMMHGPPVMFDRPFNVDLRTDQLTLQSDTAINWSSGNIVGYVRLWGHLAPREYPGAMVADTDTCSASGASESVGPVGFGNLTQSGFGRNLLTGTDYGYR